ncbi:N-acetylated-alpha-linked acidic dipeptidase 2-like [Haliotis rufescens]|uniref:N-acetylated-alpha-linked acidic dipeptidase 2-like n=1 Tax=Haliotis rufescens TaxID=6454 RepID=UPI00201F46A2|nr:N-acetylated-alpha-linked acidic dipeptidase 2-like [Haliotis rufescens]XP_046364745.2 N-acetylated-alpha-linked acidic dipeptidase 2-like [Haliotis rufescens]
MGNFELMEGSKDSKSDTTSKRYVYITGIFAIIAGLGIGIIIGRYAICPAQSKDGKPEVVPDKNGVFLPGVSEVIIKDGDPKIGKQLLDAVDNTRIESYLKHLSSKPHVAGSKNNLDLGNWIKDKWMEWGFDDVKLTPYDVLLSFPDPSNPNVVRVLNDTGGVVYQSPLKEANLTGEDDPDALPPYNAYSPAGLVEGDMVYVNYGRVEDFDWLEKNVSMNVTGKIVIVRYGKIFRGSKVQIAADHGATGVIIFSDPADYTWKGDPRVYPETWWLPGSGSQRGTIYTGDGDPLTPGYPAIKTAYRYPENSTFVKLPKIPAHPIGYDIAEKILSEMGGEEVPLDWRGGLNITYRLGGALQKTGWKMQIKISTKNEIKTAYNVIGIIKGSTEPDRYVMVGNHRDAWVYGAIDPSSGTAAIMESARAMGEMVKSGKWRPRRSIMFCSWGAEEYGLLGSNEWVEQYRKNLKERSVAYINVDISVYGNYSLRASSTPLMYRATYEAAKKVPNPNPAEVAAGRKTVYDTWLHSYPLKDENDVSMNLPKIGDLGSGSDYAPLLQKAGITAVDMSYIYNTHKYKVDFYPLYHSLYETFYAVKNIMDKQFEYHRAVSRMATELARSLADSLIIPFNVSDYSWALNKYWTAIGKDHGEKLRTRISNFDDLGSVIANFSKVVDAFNERVATMNRNDPMAIRAVNDQLTLLEKAFLDNDGLPGRPYKKHLLLAESSTDSYASSSFPGLVDLLFEIEKAPDVDARWERVKRHFSVILFTIDSAASTLRDVIRFIPENE